LTHLNSLDQLVAGPCLFADKSCTMRLVRIDSPHAESRYATCRTMSKQMILESNMKDQILGEEDIFISLGTQHFVVPQIYAMGKTDEDIHVLFNKPFVGVLDDYLDEKPLGEEAIKYYAAQLLLGLQFLHKVIYLLY